jgi:hypothetical protein
MAADFCDLQFFMLLVKQLQESGIHVAIASFGLYNVIQVLVAPWRHRFLPYPPTRPLASTSRLAAVFEEPWFLISHALTAHPRLASPHP